jgi:hypothetical protein
LSRQQRTVGGPYTDPAFDDMLLHWPDVRKRLSRHLPYQITLPAARPEAK